MTTIPLQPSLLEQQPELAHFSDELRFVDGSPQGPARRTSARVPVGALPVTAVFLSIVGLAAMDGPDVPAAMSALHSALRSPLTDPALSGLRVLSSLTGAIVLVPDALNRNVHELLPAWLTLIDAAGLPVHVGVARGLVEMIEDADGTVNAIGRCINVAARLAMSDDNPGVLYEEPYANQVLGVIRRTHFLHPLSRTPIAVKGKRGAVFTTFADPGARPRALARIPVTGPPPSMNALLIAYDLPDFSEGDLRTLASRFREVVREVQRLREEHSLPANAGVSFSPGGDGGVLALTQVPLGRAFSLATDLANLLEAASTTQADHASVRARIGVHYGQTQSYESAEGTTRPTGLALFEADGLTGDNEARRYDALVISGALIESAARGSKRFEASHFHEIPPLVTPYQTMIHRFVPLEAARGVAAADLQIPDVDMAPCETSMYAMADPDDASSLEPSNAPRTPSASGEPTVTPSNVGDVESARDSPWITYVIWAGISTVVLALGSRWHAMTPLGGLLRSAGPALAVSIEVVCLGFSLLILRAWIRRGARSAALALLALVGGWFIWLLCAELVGLQQAATTPLPDYYMTRHYALRDMIESYLCGPAAYFFGGVILWLLQSQPAPTSDGSSSDDERTGSAP